MDKQKPRLIAIAISHYCEKVRWALDYLNIDYVEEDHAPPFHSQYTSRYGGSTVPVLVTEEEALVDSHDVLQYLDSISDSKKLYPEDSQLRVHVETLEKLFDEKLGAATRTWSYYYAIQKPLIIAIAWGIKAPLIEKIKTVIAFPKMPKLLKQFYNITPKTKDAALADIKSVFTLVNQEIKSGEQYLVGNSLSAADITFAALASPVLRPPNHPIYGKLSSKMSSERALIIEELRSTPAGELAIRMYEQHRY